MTSHPGRGARRRGFSPEIQIATGVSHDGAPLHTRLYRQLREHILGGALSPGARLPSARMLAADLGISRNTVESALDQLVAEGFVVRRVGVGSMVAESLSEAAPFTKPRAAHAPRSAVRPTAPAPVSRLGRRGALMLALGQAEIDADPESVPCTTHVEGFPRKIWNRFMARQSRRGGADLLGSRPQQGSLELREQIAEYATLARGLRCEPGQVLVVSSTQQAIDLAARVLLDPGDEAFFEEPGYPSARAALRAAGARVRLVPVDEEGIEVLRLTPARGRKLLYLTPSHQFPTGVTLTLSRRLALLGWAERTGAWIIEDDYDSEFRFDGRPIAALHALDKHDRVLYVGTYNKVLFPGLRLAYLILPKALVGAFTAARRITDGYSSPLSQACLADFMASGHFASYMREARLHYARSSAFLVSQAQKAWGDAVRLGPASTGLHLVAHLDQDLDDRAIAQSVQVHGMGVAALSRYYAGERRRSGLILSYGAASLPAIAECVFRLTPLVTAPPTRSRLSSPRPGSSSVTSPGFPGPRQSR
jgi:GntR family transcriptional regulator/MocR family aminotransferase